MTCRRTTPTGVTPDMLTIEEAARVLRIGRSAAYKLARDYLATDGTSGMPAKRIGPSQSVTLQHRVTRDNTLWTC